MKKTISEVAPGWLAGKTVVVRADFNVPLMGARVTDARRIRESVPTIELLTHAGARVVLLSHLGRPERETKAEFSLAPVATELAGLLGEPVTFVSSPNGPPAAEAVRRLAPHGVALLENTRFHAGDETNDPELAAFWAGLGDLFVNDAFGVAHRAHASTSGLAEAMSARGGEAVAGLLMARELRFLEEALHAPERPFMAILGGAKISSKIGVISALLTRVDRLLIGGAMANTFFKAMGLHTGSSLVEDDSIDLAKKLLREGRERLLLPVDCIVAHQIAARVPTRAVTRDQVGDDDMIGDIGPKTRALFAEEIGKAKSIVWNGPMGVFEIDGFEEGTVAIAHAVAAACDRGALGVIGGGDSGAAVDRAGVADRVTHVSTGGGASIKLLAGGRLPGRDSLTDRG
ncbi:MAG: phosphoglycerate kinase [Gemmatimonadetes bacterium]|nr:phosphoglycerate kinase [Gemmatimonadota bacterium]